MSSYSCNVKVMSVTGEQLEGVASLEFVEGGGIDITPEPFRVQVTDDAAEIVKPGAVLRLTLAS